MVETQIKPPVFRADFNNKQFRRRERIIELSIFLFLIAPSMAFSFFLSDQGGGGNVSFTLTAVANMLRDLALIGLIMFFLWRNGEPASTVGWDFRGAGKEVLVGLALFVPFFVGVGLIQAALQILGFSSISEPPAQLAISGPGQVGTAIALVTVVAVAEETIFRGYLMARFRAITLSNWASILLSALIFSLGHGYQGSAGVVTVGIVGIFFGMIYSWRKSLVAPMTLHFLLNLFSIVVLPFIT